MEEQNKFHPTSQFRDMAVVVVVVVVVVVAPFVLDIF